jgi:hypothetical protein
MSGAGYYPAAYFDAAGVNASSSLSDPRRVTHPVAARFDGATRTFPLDDDGRVLASHPVDQAVALALLVEYGKMTAAPNSGTRIKKIKYAGGSRLEEEVRTYCREAVKRFTDAGDIREVSIKVDVPAAGRLNVEYNYVRLKDSGDRRRGVPGSVRMG